ncbi:hypothetical protein [Halobacillus naozhouensis]|uniref:Uncharacterized protein n=1 Tax=Halobacillus naozhouensis TaxID=554880 RepID=A0ABY8IZ60_9BACI|nr:hypothetical protein [Halobacillus naozhouensis]WFT74483.1 hypothetical protein P9989_19355 [Halobacillus naozhouensis]
MKQRKYLYFLLMLIFVLSFLLIAIYVFLQPEYRAQPSMREMPSMAMMMLFEFARMNEYSLRPVLEVCERNCDGLMGMGGTMPQHGNPILDKANYVFSLVLIICSAGLIGVVSVLALLWIPKLKGVKKASMRTRVLTYFGFSAGLFLAVAVFVWLRAVILQDPAVLQMGLSFWVYSLLTLLILLILVIMVIGALSRGYDYVRNQLLHFKGYNYQKQGGKPK